MAQEFSWNGSPIKAVLFDLDGTLLDTAADIALALNRTLSEYGWQPMALNDVKVMVGRGSPVLIERAAVAQGVALDPAQQAAMVERFFHHYGELEEHDQFDARPYPGVQETLPLLHQAGLRMAVVTNKQHRFAVGLLRKLGLNQWLDLVVGGDTCERRKPDPQPLLFACDSLKCAPANTLMIGDSINDVSAARAAGIPVICVPYGYNEGRDPRTLPADAIIDSIAQLPKALGQLR